MKTDKDVIAELLEIIKLLIQINPNSPAAARLASLEAWRAAVDGIWPTPTPEQEIK